MVIPSGGLFWPIPFLGKGFSQSSLHGFARPRIGGRLGGIRTSRFGGRGQENRCRRVVPRQARRWFFDVSFQNRYDRFGRAMGVEARNRIDARENPKERKAVNHGSG